MNKTTPFSLLMSLIAKDNLRGKWKYDKFRYKYLIRFMIHPYKNIKYLQSICDLSNISLLMDVNPTLPAKPQRPYLHKGGCFSSRAKNILMHYNFIQTLDGNTRKILSGIQNALLAEFWGKNGSHIAIFCTPCSFDREGELMLTLHFNGAIITRVSFLFADMNGCPAIFIGGLQGPDKGIGSEIMKSATRECYGIFPRRLLCETIGLIAEKCGLQDIFAVTEQNHVYRQFRYFYQKKGRFVASYTECWTSVGGIREGEFYRLPVRYPRKSISDIPARKRSEYRKRYCLLDEVHFSILSRL
ncbi:TPA: DUF535 domain-containing protein [Escherichia coli]|nr:DUF535 domain-containing protein [Escherichia coli]